jgi:flagellar protein FliT
MPDQAGLPVLPELSEITPGDRILLQYAALADLTSKMLTAARIEDWDALVTLEAECAAQVVTLQRAEPLSALSAIQNENKAALIVRMLADDGAIRVLVAARMAQLSNQIHSTGTERKLSRAYGA